MAEPSRDPGFGRDYPGTPRWVKGLGIAAALLILLFIILHLSGVTGGHGPGRHLRSGEAAGQRPPAGGHQ